MSTLNPYEFPPDVIGWVFDIFRQCNERLAEKIHNNPKIPEESLDMTWIEHFSQFSSSMRLASGWSIRIETHYLAGLRHFLRWEIADMGVLLFVRRGGRIVASKAALLQSKRLYPTNNRVVEEHRVDYEIGFARLADPEILSISIAVEAEFEFNEDCCYGALAAGSDQVQAIADYKEENDVKVYYQFYNPWGIPFTQRVPLSAYSRPSTELSLGTRIVPSEVVHEMVETQAEGHHPTLKELGQACRNLPEFGWPLEYFAAELFLKCREGTPFESLADERIRRLFYRRSGPIAAAISIIIEEPAAPET